MCPKNNQKGHNECNQNQTSNYSLHFMHPGWFPPGFSRFDDTHRVLLVEAVSCFSRTLPCAQPSFPQHSQQEAPADGTSKPPASKERQLGRAGSSGFQVFFSPSQLTSSMNSLPNYIPVPDVTELQKHGSIFIPKEGEVMHFIEASLAATPKDKQVRIHLICTSEQDSRTQGLQKREEDQ